MTHSEKNALIISTVRSVELIVISADILMMISEDQHKKKIADFHESVKMIMI